MVLGLTVEDEGRGLFLGFPTIVGVDLKMSGFRRLRGLLPAGGLGLVG